MLVEEIDLVLDALLVEGLDDHVAGAVGGVAGALDRAFAEIPGVSAEAALIDLAVRRAIERQSHVLEFEHRVDRFASQHFRRVLIDQIVATFDGVEHVPFPVVFFGVAEGGADAALRCAGMRSRGIELADDRNVGFAGHLDRRHQAGAAGADDDRVEAVICHGGSSE